jgi:hypothetical protein
MAAQRDRAVDKEIQARIIAPEKDESNRNDQ